jgi:hypothetical protein
MEGEKPGTDALDGKRNININSPKEARWTLPIV